MGGHCSQGEATTPSNVRLASSSKFYSRTFLTDVVRSLANTSLPTRLRALHPFRDLSVWDLRAFKKPLATRSNVLTLYPTTNAIFSPDNKYVVTGAGATTKGGKGRLLFLRKEDLEVEKEIEMEATPVVVHWHPKINQVRPDPYATRSSRQSASPFPFPRSQI